LEAESFEKAIWEGRIVKPRPAMTVVLIKSLRGVFIVR
jgi:hypothetical protein